MRETPGGEQSLFTRAGLGYWIMVVGSDFDHDVSKARNWVDRK
ncbi:hypothetical protein [Paraburkholderia bannensis]|nr:hypothetical protein [Paraburkholderia bannensis]